MVLASYNAKAKNDSLAYAPSIKGLPTADPGHSGEGQVLRDAARATSCKTTSSRPSTDGRATSDAPHSAAGRATYSVPTSPARASTAGSASVAYREAVRPTANKDAKQRQHSLARNVLYGATS